MFGAQGQNRHSDNNKLRTASRMDQVGIPSVLLSSRWLSVWWVRRRAWSSVCVTPATEVRARNMETLPAPC